jgi:hypothetical protein
MGKKEKHMMVEDDIIAENDLKENPKELINLLEHLKKEYMEIWKDFNDEVSPEIIDRAINFIKSRK